MKYKLSDLCDINIKNVNKNINKVINYIDTKSVTENNFSKSFRYNDIFEAPSRARRIAMPGDTILSTVRPNKHHYGYIDREKSNYVFSTGFLVIHPKTNIIDSYYLYLMLTTNSVTNKLQSISETSKSTYPSFKYDDLISMDFDIPSISIQKRISNVILNIDKKISLNNKINDNLFYFSIF